MISRRQRGEGKAAVIFWLLVFIVAGLFGKAWIPAKIADMELKDHMEGLAQDQRFNRADAKDFEDEIIRRAADLDIQLESKDVEVRKTARLVRMKVSYVKQINMIFTTLEWSFDHDLERDIFIV